jgi:hypothetical protein
MFETMLSRDMRQTLDHFRRTVDQLFDNFYGSRLPVWLEAITVARTGTRLRR